MSDITKPNFFLDISSDFCPMTFVKTKLQLKKMSSGEILEVKISEGEPLESVPENVEHDGHKVISVKPNGNNSRIFIQKA
ncbi:MAG: sulfurtransferase TusA family protein [Thermodesulfobacteriota bacterium]|nr:sulfurtransferase TusA family protein [Thermodesulfobacteriota bacterium]